MAVPPHQTRLILAALAIVVLAAFADWAFVSPDDPLGAFLSAAIAAGSATVVLLPFMLS